MLTGKLKFFSKYRRESTSWHLFSSLKNNFFLTDKQSFGVSLSFSREDFYAQGFLQGNFNILIPQAID